MMIRMRACMMRVERRKNNVGEMGGVLIVDTTHHGLRAASIDSIIIVPVFALALHWDGMHLRIIKN